MLLRKHRLGDLTAFAAVLLLTATSHAQAPISSCTRITSAGIYALTQNLTPTGLTCITIAADNVILDLNGFGIDQSPGAPLHFSFGISDAGVPHGDLEIRNGFMRGLRFAIFLGSSRAWVHDVRFSNIAEHAVRVGSGSLVQSCSLRGILDQIGIEGTDHLEAEHNILDGAGVICESDCLLTHNSISSTFRGILAGTAASISLNALHEIGGDGIIAGAGGSRVLQNTLTGRGLGRGITGGVGARIDRNQVSGFDIGISLESDGQVTTALVTASGHAGIVAGPRSVVESSNSSGNVGAGIQLDGSGSLARYNHIALNQAIAIDCTTTGSGSRAAHNSFSGNAKDDTNCLSQGNVSF